MTSKSPKDTQAKSPKGTKAKSPKNAPPFLDERLFEEAVADLRDFVAIRSVSHPTSPDFSPEALFTAAQFVQCRFHALGFETRLIHTDEDTKKAPFLVARRIESPQLRTVLLYGHYDVQPVDRSQWSTDPFVLTERDGRLYGRGASDDKAGIMTILTALRALRGLGRLPVNVKILLEGEEEYGSTHMPALLKQEAKALQADAVVVMDGKNVSTQVGCITSFTRGCLTMELEVQALKKPVHSGVCCIAPDPAMFLARLVSSLANPSEIPGYLHDVQPWSEAERAQLRQSSTSIEHFMEEAEMLPGTQLRGPSQLSVYERIAELPSISVMNMTSGQRGGSGSIQATAHAALVARLTAGQDPDRVLDVILAHLRAQPNEGNLTWTLKKGFGCPAWKGASAGPFARAYLDSLRENFGDSAVTVCGGSIPWLLDLQTAFPGTEMFLAGIEDNLSSAHSHNESQDIGVMRNAIRALMAFLQRMAQ